MNPIDILKKKLVSLKLSDSLMSKTVSKSKKISKQEIEADGKKVRATFKNEDLQPQISTI